jgi:hypothetical protein
MAQPCPDFVIEGIIEVLNQLGEITGISSLKAV